MTLKSIRKVAARKNAKGSKLPKAVRAARKYSREADLKEKYRTSREDLEHLFV